MPVLLGIITVRRETKNPARSKPNKIPDQEPLAFRVQVENRTVPSELRGNRFRGILGARDGRVTHANPTSRRVAVFTLVTVLFFRSTYRHTLRRERAGRAEHRCRS